MILFWVVLFHTSSSPREDENTVTTTYTIIRNHSEVTDAIRIQFDEIVTIGDSKFRQTEAQFKFIIDEEAIFAVTMLRN